MYKINNSYALNSFMCYYKIRKADNMKKTKVMVVSIVVSVVILIVVALAIFGKIDIGFRKVKLNKVVTEDKVSIDLNYIGKKLDLWKIINEFDTNDEYDGKLLDLTVTDIKIDGEEHTFKLENHPQNCIKLQLQKEYNDKHNNFYIDKTKVAHQESDGCYISALDSLAVLNKKYIAIAFRGEGNIYIAIYDDKGQKVDSIDDIIDYKLENNSIQYHEYNDNKGCYIKTVLYKIENGKPVKETTSKDLNTKCDEFRGTGCDCKQ